MRKPPILSPTGEKIVAERQKRFKKRQKAHKDNRKRLLHLQALLEKGDPDILKLLKKRVK